MTDKRASPRSPAKIPVLVEGRDTRLQPVQERTHTLLINEGGALLALAAGFQLNDHARVTNELNGLRTDCRIAWRSVEPLDGRWSYGIALLDPPDNFWGAPT